jgi:hypothetical protein
MPITFRNYSPEPFFTDDYRKVRDFLIRIDSERITRMAWCAWEWAVTHGGRDNDNLGRIGLWEDGGTLVALAAYECPLGEAFVHRRRIRAFAPRNDCLRKKKSA